MKFTPERITSTVWQRAEWTPPGYRRECSSSGCPFPAAAVLKNRTDGASRAPRSKKTVAFCASCLRRLPSGLYPAGAPPERPEPTDEELDDVAAANARAANGPVGFRRTPY